MALTKKIKDSIRYVRITLIRSIITFYPRYLSYDIADKLLIIAPHPDDEAFGCSGMVQRLQQVGKEVYLVIMTGGEGSHRCCCTVGADELKRNRRMLTLKANRLLGLDASHITFLDYPDGGIDFDCCETNKLQEIIDRIQPDVLFVPHHGEGWEDHVNTGKIVKNLIAGDECVSLYEYCVWFWYYNTWDINWKQARVLKLNAQQHESKLKSINSYITPLAPCGKPWSGVLPRVFIKANSWNKELYFKIQ